MRTDQANPAALNPHGRILNAIFAFLLFGVCFGHLGYFANDTQFRSLILSRSHD